MCFFLQGEATPSCWVPFLGERFVEGEWRVGPTSSPDQAAQDHFGQLVQENGPFVADLHDERDNMITKICQEIHSRIRNAERFGCITDKLRHDVVGPRVEESIRCRALDIMCAKVVYPWLQKSISQEK